MLAGTAGEAPLPPLTLTLALTVPFPPSWPLQMICDAADAAVYANSSAWTALNTGCGNFCGVKMFAGPACATQCFSSSNSFGNTLSADCADCTGQQSYCVVQNCVLGGASVCILDSSSPGCVSCSDAACLDAFLNCSGLPARALPAPAPMCNATDTAVYANSSAWTALVTSCGDTCGFKTYASPACATQCLESSLSADCAECAGNQSHCVATNCLGKCAADSTTPGCVACADAACLGAFLECSGIGGGDVNAPPHQEMCDAADAAVYADAAAWTALVTRCGRTCGRAMFDGPACATQCLHSDMDALLALPPPPPPLSPPPPRQVMCNAADVAVYTDNSAWTALVTSCGNTCGQEVLDPGSSCAAACFSYSLSADCAECAGKHPHCVATNCLVECAADSTTPGCVACADAACLGAFLECSGINAPSRSLPPSPSPSNSLSAGCAGCAGQQSYCVTTNCLGECGTDSSTPGCVTCAQATCLDAFFSCSGLSHRVPTPPSPPSPPSLPPPPSVVVELKVTGTFEEFRKPSVVEDIKTKLASASGVDAAYVTITVRDASGNLISESQGSAFSGSRRLSESFEFSISMIIAIPLGKTVEEVLAETNTALASPAIATATLGRAVSAIEVLVGAPPSAPPPTPSPPPSDLLDPPFGSSNSTFACSDADSKLYANTSVWVGFSLECGLGCGVGAMLANPNCAGMPRRARTPD